MLARRRVRGTVDQGRVDQGRLDQARVVYVLVLVLAGCQGPWGMGCVARWVGVRRTGWGAAGEMGGDVGWAGGMVWSGVECGEFVRFGGRV